MPCHDICTKMHLAQRSNSGIWFDKDGNTCACTVSVGHEGDIGLAIRASILDEYQKKYGVSIIWTCLGEKNIIGSIQGEHGLPQWLELSGVYEIEGDCVVDHYNTYVGDRKYRFD